MTQQGRVRGGKGFMRGSSQAFVNQLEGRGQPRIFAFAQRNDRASNVIEITPGAQEDVEDQPHGEPRVGDGN